MFQQGLHYEIMTRGWGKTEDPGYVKSKYVWKYMGVENSFHKFDSSLQTWYIPSTMLKYHMFTLSTYSGEHSSLIT
jgi:hypothetical protein